MGTTTRRFFRHENDGEEVYRKYLGTVVRIVRNRLKTAGVPNPELEADEVAASAFERLLAWRDTHLDFQEAPADNQLWPLLATIVHGRIVAKLREREQTPLPLDADEPLSSDQNIANLDSHQLLAAMRDSGERQVAQLSLEGQTSGQIADRLGVSLQAVTATLQRIKRLRRVAIMTDELDSTPALTDIVVETIDRLVEILKDDETRSIATLHLNGHSDHHIASEMRVPVYLIKQHLRVILSYWREADNA